MKLDKFFDEIRATAFGGKLSRPQVEGIEALLDACDLWGVTDPHHVANIVAQAWRETGGYMSPIKETVQAYHTDKSPSDAVVKRRLDAAWAAGKLGNVKSPYWRDGWFGRGQIQISHKGNYEKLGEAIGVDLVGNPSAALEMKNSASIAVIGMSRGLFTGKKLSDYDFPKALDAPAKDNPRRIVNGNDGSDKEVAEVHKAIYAALVNAGWGKEAPSQQPEVPKTEKPKRTRAIVIAEIEALLSELKSLGG